ncbi:hypothetical protein BDP55DRAFT_671972, partial [Colletotrichum godetiae]
MFMDTYSPDQWLSPVMNFFERLSSTQRVLAWLSSTVLPTTWVAPAPFLPAKGLRI